MVNHATEKCLVAKAEENCHGESKERSTLRMPIRSSIQILRLAIVF